MLLKRLSDQIPAFKYNNKITLLMSYQILAIKHRNPLLASHKAASLSCFSKKDTRQLETVYNVSFTDYCGLSLKNRSKSEALNSHSILLKRKSQQLRRNQKKNEPTLERGDSFKVEAVRICDSPRAKQERVKTEYSHSRIFKSNKNKSLQDFYRAYELEFLEKKLAVFGAEGHKLQLARFNGMNAKERRGALRPNTAYLKRVNPHLPGDPRKIKTIDFKNLKRKEESFFAISGWEDEFEDNEP